MRLWQPAAHWLGRIPHPQRYEGAISRVLLFAVLSFSAPMFLVPELGQLGRVLAGMLSADPGLTAILASGGKLAAFLGGGLASLVILNDFLIRWKSTWHVEAVAESGGWLAVGYAGLFIILTIVFGNLGATQFVYFQF